MRNKLGYIVLVLLVSQLALILLSWLVTAAFPELPMRSVLSSEGIRWFFGSFVSNQLSPLLIYFIMAVMAVGACVRSRLYDALRETLSNTRSSLTTSSNHQHKVHYREKVGLRIALVEFIVYVIIMILLTAIPHAILLSVTGQLFPSSFSSSFIPSLSLIIIIMSLTYGVASGTIDSVAKMHKVLVGGLEVGSRLVPTYVVGIQLYMSIRYVFIL
ncbi:AbgT family transporter [Prevotella sp. oral taxon 313]|uniref:AbgT family transporter n=1 Tax=Prevotella sp. oral taxon 313 TaxID=652722 RepID=UPI000D1E97CA|nr:AbgT family transporter [Prevotella sp. oral taxon 313]PTL29795.1 ABC transporter permease [Prevotella sp. oral taxon 313]